MTGTDFKTIVVTAIIVAVVVVGGLGLSGMLHSLHAL